MVLRLPRYKHEWSNSKLLPRADLSEKLLHRQSDSNLDEVIESLFKEILTLGGAAKLQDSQSLETLYSRLTSHGDCAEDINTPKGDIEKDLLRVLSYQAESAKVLRLLATVYLEWDCQKYLEKAIHAVSLANKEHMQLSGLYLKSRILVKSSSPDDAVKSGLSELLDCEVPLEVCLSTVKLLVDENREALAFDFLKRVCQHFESSPELGSALLMHIELLLQRDKELLAKQKIEDAINGHYTGKQLTPQTQSSLHILLWDRAFKNFEDQRTLQEESVAVLRQASEGAPVWPWDWRPQWVKEMQRGMRKWSLEVPEWKCWLLFDEVHRPGLEMDPDGSSWLLTAKNYSEALQWYNYSLSFYKAGELDPNLAKLQRNRSSCFLQLQQLDKAKEAVEEAVRIDPNNIFTQFNIYKIAVLMNNAEKAAVALREIGALAQTPVTSEDRLLVTENAAANLLSLAVQIALEHEQQETAIKALESLCEHSQDVAQILTALRCLVRLVLSTMENTSEENRNANLDTLLSYLRTALQKVSQISRIQGQGAEEANWFRRIAWNSALQCEHSPMRMRDFFLLSFQLSQLCVPDRAVLMGQKTCLLMAAAASLEICRSSDHTEQQTELLTQTLEHIQLCKEIWTTIKASGTSPKDKTDTLLLLYEFEARAKLNDAKLESVLESILELDHIETKLLEMIAVLAMEPPAHFPVLCKKALRIALSLHRKQPQADLTRCSNCLHSLIQLTLPSGVSEVQPCVLEEVWSYYEQALSIIASAPEDFPELEILWLLTRAWNTGILLYSLTQYPEAERWCGLGMSFLRHLGSLQDSYQTQRRLAGEHTCLENACRAGGESGPRNIPRFPRDPDFSIQKERIAFLREQRDRRKYCTSVSLSTIPFHHDPVLSG
ncbi:Testis-expressed protein 11 [Anabarilius grahami]|uniref:Protein ZIP4 homolog n=1 Tax=Anabarilius grahami TaxID=495550 RepID=A0A3N0Z1G5_ANAGA|nr:Testis-expressed protein 11 [Anabarilius grahami]